MEKGRLCKELEEAFRETALEETKWSQKKAKPESC